MRWALTVILVCSCGRIGFDPADGEDGVLEEADTDAGVAPLDFFELGPFSAPVRLAEISDATDNDCHPSLTEDLLEVVFTSNRSGSRELYSATRADPNSKFGAPRLLTELSSPDNQTTPEISADGLVLWFASNRGGGFGGLDIYVAKRATRADNWSAPKNVTKLNSPDDEHSPAPNSDQTTLVLTRTVDGRKRDLLIATRQSSSEAWAKPTALDTINTKDQDADGFIDASGRFLLFDSDRLGNGFRDMFVSTLDDDGVWGPAVEIPELNTDRSDADPWLSADYRTMVFSSSREGADDLFIATR